MDVIEGITRTIRVFADDFIETSDGDVIRRWDGDTFEFRPDGS